MPEATANEMQVKVGGVDRTTTGGQLSTCKGQEKDREMASGEEELSDVQINRDDTICS